MSDYNDKEEWASPKLMEMVEKSLAEMHDGVSGLYADIIAILGEPITVEWTNQIQMSRKDAMYLKMKYGKLIAHISE